MRNSSDYRYKAFISYSHEDEGWARWLHRSLESYRIPKHVVRDHGFESNRLLPIFRDRDELASSANLSEVIQHALDGSEHLIVICSPAAARSRWVNEEVSQFKRMGKADRVQCLLLGDPEESFPPAALVDVNQDGHATAAETEPLAADARPSSDGRQTAKLKLISGLLGIGFDELRQRENRRRVRRLAVTAGTSVVGMAFAIGIAALAVLARQEADLQRDRAEAVRGFLEEVLVASDPWEGGGEASVRDVLDRAASNVAQAYANQPFLEADLRLTLAETYEALGLWDRAERQASIAHDLRRQTIGENHEDTMTALLRVGQGQIGQDKPEAIETLRTVVSGLKSTIGSDAPETVEAAQALATALIRSGDFAEAIELQEEVVAIRERTLGPTDEETLHSRVALGEVLHQMGDGERAAKLYQSVLDAQSGEPTLWQLESSVGLARVYVQSRDLEPAEFHARAAYATSIEILGEDHPTTATVATSLANVLWESKRYEEAEPYYTRVADIYREQLGEQHQWTLVGIHNLANNLMMQGELERARTLHGQNLDRFVELLGAEHPNVARSRAALAETYQRDGDSATAVRLLSESVATLEASLGPSHPVTVRTTQRLISALQDEGRCDEAGVLSERLIEFGPEEFSRLEEKQGACLMRETSSTDSPDS